MSICHPRPAQAGPPMIWSTGTTTSRPSIGPLGKKTPMGSWRRPISTPFGGGGHEHAGDAHVLALAQAVVGVDDLHRETDQGGDRSERDVALLEGQAEEETAVRGREDDAPRAHGRRVRPRLGLGEGEAGDLLSAGEAGEVVVLLVPGAVGGEQLGRPHGVGDEDERGEGEGARGQLAEDGGAAEGGEFPPAVLLGDHEPEEAVSSRGRGGPRGGTRAAGSGPTRRPAGRLPRPVRPGTPAPRGSAAG